MAPIQPQSIPISIPDTLLGLTTTAAAAAATTDYTSGAYTASTRRYTGEFQINSLISSRIQFNYCIGLNEILL